MTNKFEFNGEAYRDDRLYVMNIATATMSKDNKKCWNLATYRNNLSLSATRNDFFDTRKELIDYIKEVEPQVPLISNNGQPLEIPNHIKKDDIVWTTPITFVATANSAMLLGARIDFVDIDRENNNICVKKLFQKLKKAKKL